MWQSAERSREIEQTEAREREDLDQPKRNDNKNPTKFRRDNMGGRRKDSSLRLSYRKAHGRLRKRNKIKM